jgi:hypothetical protein
LLILAYLKPQIVTDGQTGNVSVLSLILYSLLFGVLLGGLLAFLVVTTLVQGQVDQQIRANVLNEYYYATSENKQDDV